MQTSQYSKLAGVPVALIGLIGYIAILGSLLAPEEERWRFATVALTLGGFGFSVYLTYREVFSLEAICEYCVGSAVLMTILLGLSAVALPARRRTAGRGPAPRQTQRPPASSRRPPTRRLSAGERSKNPRRAPDVRALARVEQLFGCQCVQRGRRGRAREPRAADVVTTDGSSIRPAHRQPPRRPSRHADAGVRKLFEMTSDLLATISLDGCFTLLNPAWEQLLGWTREELQSRPVDEFVHPDDDEQLLGPMRAGGGHPAEVENFTTRYRHRDGSWRWLLWSARRDGDTWYAAAKDVTDRMWLERQALHDPLTKLPNRTLLMDRARQAIARLHRSAGVLAMLFIDLDKFKAVNDNLGHDVGDRLLVSISERLSELMRDSDTIARLGGDEFVILAEELESEDEAMALAGRVLDALEEPFPLGSAEVAMLASVGISIARTPRPTPRRCCARPTWRCTRPRAPAAGAWSSSTRACAAR